MLAQINQPSAEVTWHEAGTGRIPVSTRFDDPYYSLHDGLAEARHVFLAGNDLPARFRDGLHIAELGFGTGLNLFAAALAWQAAGIGGQLRFTSFEAFPVDAATAEAAWAAFPEVAPIAAALAPLWQGTMRVTLPWLRAEVIPGDARQTLPAWAGAADAWFLDGFSPARNPELWEPALLAAMGEHTSAGGTCATYSAAGDVRRALTAAGFAVDRVPGYGRKRHMTRGRRG
ncbi:MAG: tRNA (5-methylaminomethyl-2-thiouridine)(34)-methyltransferase MnmD [Pseudomonadota bacterium]